MYQDRIRLSKRKPVVIGVNVYCCSMDREINGATTVSNAKAYIFSFKFSVSFLVKVECIYAYGGFHYWLAQHSIDAFFFV